MSQGAAMKVKATYPGVITKRHKKVLSLSPVGYWPADQGSGKVLSDLSPTQNNGVIHNVPWDKDKKLLHFTGAFQFLEIPQNPAYQTPAFSMGGWVFFRSEVIGSGHGHNEDGGPFNRQGFLLIGNHKFSWSKSFGAMLCIRRQELIDVEINGKRDVLGTRLHVHRKDGKIVNRAHGKPNLAIGQWHHLIYTFEDGTGKLYLNGKQIASKGSIKYKPVDINLRIGNDAGWWHQMRYVSGSLDGSVRDMVWFDRAVSAEEAENLCQVTRPDVKPEVYDDTIVVLDGRPIYVKDIASLSPTTRRTVLLLLGRKSKAVLQKLGAQLLPMAKKALGEANNRFVAAELLLKLNDEEDLKSALPALVAVVKNQTKSDQERADAALALAAMGRSAASAVPALAKALDQLVPQDSTEFPRVDEVLRNSLTRALFDLNPKNQEAKKVIERTFSRTLHPRKDENFLTFKLPGNNDYTGRTSFKGVTYKVGTGIGWQGVEKVPVDEYEEIVEELSEEYPKAKSWRKPTHMHLYRVPVTKIGADGVEQKIYLEGKEFILDGSDGKCRAWSIYVDELGYVHLMGGQHNKPNPNVYIPGSWEKMGVSRDKESDDYPMQMYWVSTTPESIDSFKFAGQRNNPQAIPASYLNYPCFEQSFANEIYLYGRAKSFGLQCWGLYRYSAKNRRWTVVGGDPYSLIESVRKQNPTWIDCLHGGRASGNDALDKPSDSRVLVWAWQPPFYNFCRDEWGVKFDKTGRMHVQMKITGLDGAGYVRFTQVYAYSDDRGETFHRADGSPVKLPLTVNPAPEYNSEIELDQTIPNHNGNQYLNRQWLELWLGLLKDAGYRT